MRHITDISPSELLELTTSLGEPSYRTKQIYQWIYKYLVDSFDKMLNLPKSFRDKLKSHLAFNFPNLLKVVTSEDGTQKFLVQYTDGAMIETVLIRERTRHTLCLSTQVGCRQGCTFCVTGRLGFYRHLLHHEISDQVLIVESFLKPQKITHIVLMGMGEPLDNYQNVIRAIKTLIDSERRGFSPRRITLSTSGLISGIEALSKEGLKVKLAISLNAPNNAVRNAIMPINKRFPLQALIECLKRYPLLYTSQKITLEYCMMRGINDSHVCAMELASLLTPIKKRVKINLIPYNSNPILPFKSSTRESLEKFQGLLLDKGIMSTARKSKGGDILAACGQLGYEVYMFKKHRIVSA